MKAIKRILPMLLCVSLLLVSARATETVTLPEGEEALAAFAAAEEERTRPTALTGEGDIAVTAKSAVLIDKATGTVIYAKNENEMLPPASVTKIMTMLLTVEAIESGAITTETSAACSDYASSMGGSQIFMAPGEQMTVHELLKSVAVGSANDASVVLAELISGSEAQFVRKMNERAKQLGMEHTEFHNCTGLPDSPGNLISAYDVALMSRMLLSYDIIREYTTIWMDSVRNGTFGLANTNKLIYYYSGATGLKTGFTQEAGFCVSASAMRGESEFIAVVLGDESSDARWKSARAMLDFAFANYCNAPAAASEALPPVKVSLGKAEYVQGKLQSTPWLLLPKSVAGSLERKVELLKSVNAPVAVGDKLGVLTITSGEKLITEIPIVAADPVEQLGVFQIFVNFLRILCFG